MICFPSLLSKSYSEFYIIVIVSRYDHLAFLSVAGSVLCLCLCIKVNVRWCQSSRYDTCFSTTSEEAKFVIKSSTKICWCWKIIVYIRI